DHRIQFQRRLGIEFADSIFAKANRSSKKFPLGGFRRRVAGMAGGRQCGTAVYRVVALKAQTGQAQEANRGLQESADAMRKAVEAHEKTVLDLAAAEAASQDSRAIVLSLEQDFAHQRPGLNKMLGVEPTTHVRLRSGLTLPTHLEPPDEADLLANIESRWLDLLGLRQGYLIQDATVRAAILVQFSKLYVAFIRAI